MVEREDSSGTGTADTKRPILLAVSTIIILIIVISGVFVYIFSEEKVSKVVLGIFVLLVLVLGLAMIVFIEYQRRKALANKDRGAQQWIHNTIEAQYRRPKPSAPPLSERSSWALIPRKWSTGTALPAYSPNTAPIREIT